MLYFITISVLVVYSILFFLFYFIFLSLEWLLLRSVAYKQCVIRLGWICALDLGCRCRCCFCFSCAFRVHQMYQMYENEPSFNSWKLFSLLVGVISMSILLSRYIFCLSSSIFPILPLNLIMAFPCFVCHCLCRRCAQLPACLLDFILYLYMVLHSNFKTQS